MAGDDHYLVGVVQPHQLLDMFDTPWEYPNYSPMSQTTALRTADGPYLQITEQPKQRGFRFRYGCEGPSHGGLPGASSEKNRKMYPTVKIQNYQGTARVVVQLVTANSTLTHLHAHSLVGKQCDKGICITDLQAKDSTMSFPNLGILHVTKKNVSKTLEERMTEAYRMGYNCGVSVHPEIDNMLGEVRVPRELTEHQRSLISSAAAHQSKDMDLSVVRLMFTAFLPDSDGGFSRRLDPVVSEPIYDSKAPNASNLKIVRMDRTAGCVTGGEEVYLLCDKVQKDDIQVRFYEENDSGGLAWEALGDFSPTDVHRQFAIVFKTPKYRDQNLQKPTSVFVQLKRKSDNETSEPKPFTYHPQIIDKEEVQRKRQKTLPNFQDFSGHGGGGGGGGGAGLYRGGGGGGGQATGGGPGSGGGGYFQGFSGYSYGGGYTTGYSAGLAGSGGSIKHATESCAAEDDGGDDSDPDDDSASGAVQRDPAQSEERREGDGANVDLGQEVKDGEWDRICDLERCLVEAAGRHAEALFQYAVSGDPAYLLVPQRHLMTAQDEDGDTGLHLGVIHSQGEAVRRLAQVLCALPGEDVLNMRNHLYQTPLHLAVITQQKEAAEALLLAGADAALTDRRGNTALHLAAQQGEEGGGAMVGFLLQHRQVAELLDQPNAAGECAVHLAVRANSLRSLRELLEGGADVEAQDRGCGRTALHLATEVDNVSLAGCLLLEGNANVDCCTFNGSTPLHIAAGRGSVKLTALLVAAGADPHKENFEPLYFKEEEDCCQSDDEEEDEGYIPGTTPLSMAVTPQVLELLNGKEYEPEQPSKVYVPPQGDLASLGQDTKRVLCQSLEGTEGGWESLAHTLGLGILNSAFRLSPSPATTLLDSYEVSGGTVRDLAEGLKSLGNCTALAVLEEALHHMETAETSQSPTTTEMQEEGEEGVVTAVQELKLDGQTDSGVCDSGVELSTA